MSYNKKVRVRFAPSPTGPLLFTTQTLVPMIFVFGVFLISLKTHGYCYGITSAIVSVFAVNFVAQRD